MALILWIIAVVLVVAGIMRILRAKDMVGGIALIIVGFLVGPGGVSIFTAIPALGAGM